jgi:Leucine-rich repeat (LRR) protein
LNWSHFENKKEFIIARTFQQSFNAKIKENLNENTCILECFSNDLKLNHLSICNIDSDMFADFKKIKKIDLSHNNMKSLSEATFPGFLHLEELDLSYNNLTGLLENLFNPLVNLKRLYLEYCNLNELNENLFAGLVSLVSLNLSRNPLKCIQKNVFSKLKILEKLDLNGCNISNLKSNQFDGLSNLQELNISYEKAFDLDAYNSMPELIKLCIVTSDDEAINLKNLNKLKELELSLSARLEHLTLADLKNLINLKLVCETTKKNYSNQDRLKCKFNNRSNLFADDLTDSNFYKKNRNSKYHFRKSHSVNRSIFKDIYFGSFENLESLVIQNIAIKDKMLSSIGLLSKLKYLELSSNYLTYIDDTILSCLKSLVELKIKSNPIAFIKRNTFRGLFNLEVLILCGNQIKFVEENSFMDLKRLSQLDISNNKIRTINNKTFNGLLKLTCISIRNNFIRSIDARALVELKHLEKIDFDGEILNKCDILNTEMSIINL